MRHIRLRHGGGGKPFICWALAEFKFSNFANLPNKSYFLFVVLNLFQHLTGLEDLLDFNSSPRERTEHLTSLRVKSVLGEGLTNCARKLDPHQEIQARRLGETQQKQEVG